jgi:hypothetical protein
MIQIIRPKNWTKFQHYKNRSPIWIKLHRCLLDDFEFQGLPLASRALAPMLWLLASEASNGDITHDARKIAFRLRVPVEEVEAGLPALLSAGFFEVITNASATLSPSEQDASSVLAERYRHAMPEKEKNKVEKEKEKEGEEEKNARASAHVPPPEESVLNDEPNPDFDEFWDVYPVKKCRDEAKKAYLKARSRASPAVLLAAAKRYAADCKLPGAAYPKYPQKWLDEGRWTDATGPPNGLEKLDAATAAALADKADRLLKRGKYAEH